MTPLMIGIVAALGSAASWAIGAFLFKRLAESMSSPAMTMAKSAVSVVLLGVATVCVGYQRLDWPTLGLLVVSGLIGIAVADTLFFAALHHLAARDVVLLMTMGQVFTILLALTFLHERLLLAHWAGIALILLGVTVVLLPRENTEPQSTNIRGVVFGLLSALFMAISLIIAKKALNSVSALQSTFIRMLAGSLGMFIVGVAGKQFGKWVTPIYNVRFLLLLFVSVCVITFGGFWLSLVAIKNGEVAINSTLIGTEPMFALVISSLFLQERITPRAGIGTAVALCGVVVLCAHQLGLTS